MPMTTLEKLLEHLRAESQEREACVRDASEALEVAKGRAAQARDAVRKAESLIRLDAKEAPPAAASQEPKA